MENIGPATTRGVLGHLRTVFAGPDRAAAPTAERPRSKIRGYATPLALLALAGLGLGSLAYFEDSRDISTALAIVLAVGSVLPVAIALRRPLLAWRLAFVMQFLGVINADPAEPWPWNPVQILGFLIVLVAVAVRGESAVTGWVATISLIPVFIFAPDANAYGAATGVLAVALAGEVIGRRRQNRRALAEQAEVSELERARRAVLEERARIAREMHDVVAHHMSMIAVQAETAPYRLTGLPEPALAELATIATAARSALSDMRRLLGVLRSDTDDDTPLTPQPGLAELPALVETAQRAGLQVSLTSSPADGAEPAYGVPQAVGLAAYRIVQEALANAARHAPGGPVKVTVSTSGTSAAHTSDPANPATANRLDLVVHSGPAAPGSPGFPAREGQAEIGTGPVGMTGQTGHGLVGMRERAALLGGVLRAGPDGDGGYTVTARLPYDDEGPA
jgi:signal transduction histidine kinase